MGPILLDVHVIDYLYHLMSTKSDLLGPSRKLAAAVSAGVMGLAGIFFLIMLAVNLVKTMLGEGKQNFNFLWKYFALLMALVLYTTLMPLVDMAVNLPLTAVKKIAGSTTGGSGSAKKINKAIDDSNTKTAPPAPDDGTSINPLSFFDPRNLGKAMLTGIIETLFTLVQGVLIFVQVYALAILYVTGPIAIAWSVLAGFEGSLLGWLKYYVVIKLWAVIIYVIEALSALLLAGSIDSSTGLASWESLTIQAGLVLVYCMVPKFADILISGSQGGAFFSAAVAAGSKGLSSAISPATNAASQYMAGKNLGQFGNAASSALQRLGERHGQAQASANASPGGTKVD